MGTSMWKIIRLELARTPDFPSGRRDCGYEITAPVDATGHLAATEWAKARTRAVVRRFWHGKDDEHGNLIHTRHRAWAFSYRPGEDDDEPLYRLENHRLVDGEYVSVSEGGVVRPYHIVSVRPFGTDAMAEAARSDR